MRMTTRVASTTISRTEKHLFSIETRYVDESTISNNHWYRTMQLARAMIHNIHISMECPTLPTDFGIICRGNTTKRTIRIPNDGQGALAISIRLVSDELSTTTLRRKRDSCIARTTDMSDSMRHHTIRDRCKTNR